MFQTMKGQWFKAGLGGTHSKFYHSAADLDAAFPEHAARRRKMASGIAGYPEDSTGDLKRKLEEFSLHLMPPNWESSFLFARNPIHCDFKAF